ncbi:MAG: YdaS family helix-turn-helix protein [Gammaproteobacteria bacterium]
MELGEFIKSHPRRQRMQLRRCLADAHGISEVTVRSWANGQRRHPCRLAAVEITEKVTGGRVTRYDLRPDVFGNQLATEGSDKGVE